MGCYPVHRTCRNEGKQGNGEMESNDNYCKSHGGLGRTAGDFWKKTKHPSLARLVITNWLISAVTDKAQWWQKLHLQTKGPMREVRAFVWGLNWSACLPVCRYTCACGGQRSDIILNCSPSVFIETGPLTEPGSHRLTRLSGQQTSRDPPVSASSALGLQAFTITTGFLWGCWESKLRSSYLSSKQFTN